MVEVDDIGKFRRLSGLRPVALGLAILLSLLQIDLVRAARFRGPAVSVASIAPIGAFVGAAAAAATDEQCAPGDDGVPVEHCDPSAGTCCLACDRPAASCPPLAESGGLVNGPVPQGRIFPAGGSRLVAHVVSGWRSSWSAQAPPLLA
jgi:hypothetical protein